MCERNSESMDILLSNYDVQERLVQFLPVPDVVALGSISREWRDVLGREMVWRRVARREGGYGVWGI